MNPADLNLWLSTADGCPPPAALAAAAAGELEPAVVARLEAHAAACPLCEAERDLAAAFLGPQNASFENADTEFVVAQLAERLPRSIPALARPARNVLSFRSRRSPSPGARPARRWNWPRLAAAAVLALGLGLSYRAWRPADLPEPSGMGALRGGLLEARSPVGDIADLPQRWSWTPAEGAALYRVSLLGVDDATLWRGETSRPEIVPGESVAALVRRAVRYRWTVTAVDGAGQVLAESPEAWFRLRPANP